MMGRLEQDKHSCFYSLSLVGSLSHPAKFAVQDRVLDNRFCLSGLAPAMQHRHGKVHVGCHHPYNALLGPHADTRRARDSLCFYF